LILESKLVLQKIDRNLLIMLAGLLLGVALGVSPLLKHREAPLVAQPQSIELAADPVGFAAGDFSLLALTGESVRLGDYLGKPVIINFWATWCAPCELEMPLFQEYYDKYAPDLQVLAVNFNEPVEDIQPFVDRLGMTFPVLLDPDGKVGKLYRVHALPVTYFIDRQGSVQGMYLGTLSKAKFEEFLTKIGVGE
jgi:thiol-disulfide isomerase/thioredoxin